MPTHITVSGQEIEYPEPDPALATILRKLTRMANNPRVTEAEMIEVAFSDRNPLLGPYVVPGRGAVTTETLASPAWYVIQDLLAQKQLEEKGVDKEKLAAEHTLSVIDAAETIGMSTSGAQHAIKVHRLPVWVKDGRSFISPRNAALYKIGNTGPLRGRVRPELEPEPLIVRTGNVRGVSFSIWTTAERELKKVSHGITEGTIRDWKAVGVKMGLAKDYRFALLRPRAKVGRPDELPHDQFYVRGYFQTTTVNDSDEAHEAWNKFKKENPAPETRAERGG